MKEKAGARAKKDKADEVETHRRTAGSALQAACSQDAFKEAIEAVQLFLPGCPLLGCLRFLQVWPLTQILTRFISTQFAIWNVVLHCYRVFWEFFDNSVCSAGRAAGTGRWRPIWKRSPAP